ncbi:hypothetical protein MNV49_007409 [Pseudohyphozyma bogoriensis]|nr:hypothetical protein MNV49_007409 [Pseudohyphozyma bogoriensis]
MAQDGPSVFASNTSVGKLNHSDSAAYLARIGLSSELLASPASLDLLRTLQYAHLTSVPFESTRLHVKDEHWSSPDVEVKLRGGDGFELGRKAYDRIVKQRRGGYCFVLNSTFAALLRNWFVVSELAGMIYMPNKQDPAVAGWIWGPTQHQVLAVGWPGERDRYYVDVGFGGGQCPHPIPLIDGATSDSTNPRDSYVLRHEALRLPPSTDASILQPDPTKYWTIYRWSTRLPIAIPSDPSTGFWTPLYAFQLQTVLQPDFAVKNFFASHYEGAVFTNFFVATVLNKEDGSRTTLQYRVPGEKDGDGKTLAKLLTTGGKDSAKRNEPQWIEMKTGPLRQVLERDFGFLFD